MNTLTHSQAQDQIQSRQKLNAEEQAALAAHLAACPECRAYAALHANLAGELPGLFPARRHSPQEIRQKARGMQTRLEQKTRAGRLAFATRLAAAAGMAIVALLAILLLPGHLPRLLPALRPQQTSMQILDPSETAAALAYQVPTQTPLSEKTRLAPTASPTPTAAVIQAAPANPNLPQPTPTAGLIHTVARIGDTAYTGSGARLLAVDVSQPSAPQLLAESETLPGEVLKIIPLTQVTALTAAESTLVAEGTPAAVLTPVVNRTRVAASAGRYLAVFDIATPGQLGLVTQSKLPGPITALVLEINTNRLYVGGVQNSDPAKGFISLFDTSPAETLQLLGSLPLDAPVRNLALNAGRLYAALGGARPGVSAIQMEGDSFGAPRQVIPDQTVYSMTTAGDGLYIGTRGRLLAYRLNGSTPPELAWQVDQAGGQPLPGPILSFELRPTSIYAAGLDSAGQPFRLALQPPEAINASSTVDTASLVAVGDGLMLVAGERLEIYDILATPELKLLGTYPGN